MFRSINIWFRSLLDFLEVLRISLAPLIVFHSPLLVRRQLILLDNQVT